MTRRGTQNDCCNHARDDARAVIPRAAKRSRGIQEGVTPHTLPHSAGGGVVEKKVVRSVLERTTAHGATARQATVSVLETVQRTCG